MVGRVVDGQDEDNRLLLEVIPADLEVGVAQVLAGGGDLFGVQLGSICGLGLDKHVVVGEVAPDERQPVGLQLVGDVDLEQAATEDGVVVLVDVLGLVATSANAEGNVAVVGDAEAVVLEPQAVLREEGDAVGECDLADPVVHGGLDLGIEGHDLAPLDALGLFGLLVIGGLGRILLLVFGLGGGVGRGLLHRSLLDRLIIYDGELSATLASGEEGKGQGQGQVPHR